MLGWVLASIPALPWHAAGTYIVGAYILLLLLVLVYLAYRAARISDTERELDQLQREVEASSRRTGEKRPNG